GCGPASADVGDYHEHTETAQYVIDITYPLDYPDARSVSDFVNADRGYFLDWVTRFGANGPVRQYMYDVSAKTYEAREPATTSVVLTIENDTGAAHEAHPETVFRAFDFDLTKRIPITIATLFKPGVDVVSVLGPKVATLYARPTFTLTPLVFQNFVLTDEAVIFFFGEGQLIPADNTGPRQISVPRDELAPLLA
ncbi:MAG: hypothetical protein ACXVGO_16080, partial [Mycobacterium sp.]